MNSKRVYNKKKRGSRFESFQKRLMSHKGVVIPGNYGWQTVRNNTSPTISSKRAPTDVMLELDGMRFLAQPKCIKSSQQKPPQKPEPRKVVKVNKNKPKKLCTKTESKDEFDLIPNQQFTAELKEEKPKKKLLNRNVRYPGRLAVMAMRLELIKEHIKREVPQDLQQQILSGYTQAAEQATPCSVGEILTEPVKNAIVKAFGVTDALTVGACASAFISFIAACVSLATANSTIAKLAAVTGIVSSLVTLVCTLGLSSTCRMFAKETFETIKIKITAIVNKVAEMMGIKPKKDESSDSLLETEIKKIEELVSTSKAMKGMTVNRSDFIAKFPNLNPAWFDLLPPSMVCGIFNGQLDREILEDYTPTKCVERSFIPTDNSITSDVQLASWLSQYATSRTVSRNEFKQLFPMEQATLAGDLFDFLPAEAITKIVRGHIPVDIFADVIQVPSRQLRTKVPYTTAPITAAQIRCTVVSQGVVKRLPIIKIRSNGHLITFPMSRDATTADVLNYVQRNKLGNQIWWNGMEHTQNKMLLTSYNTDITFDTVGPYDSDSESDSDEEFTDATDTSTECEEAVLAHEAKVPIELPDLTVNDDESQLPPTTPEPPTGLKIPVELPELEVAPEGEEDVLYPLDLDDNAWLCTNISTDVPTTCKIIYEKAKAHAKTKQRFAYAIYEEGILVEAWGHGNPLNLILDYVEENWYTYVIPGVTLEDADLDQGFLLTTQEGVQEHLSSQQAFHTNEELYTDTLTLCGYELVQDLPEECSEATTQIAVPQEDQAMEQAEEKLQELANQSYAAALQKQQERTAEQEQVAKLAAAALEQAPMNLPTPKPVISPVSPHFCTAKCAYKADRKCLQEVKTIADILPHIVKIDSKQVLPDIPLDEHNLKIMHIPVHHVEVPEPSGIYRACTSSVLCIGKQKYFVMSKMFKRPSKPGVLPPSWGIEPIQSWAGAVTDIYYDAGTMFVRKNRWYHTPLAYAGMAPSMVKQLNAVMAKALKINKKHQCMLEPEKDVFFTTWQPHTIFGVKTIDYFDTKPEEATPCTDLAEDTIQVSDLVKMFLGSVACVGVGASMATQGFSYAGLTRNIAFSGRAVNTLSDATDWVADTFARSTTKQELEKKFQILKREHTMLMAMPASVLRVNPTLTYTIRRVLESFDTFRAMLIQHKRSSMTDYYMRHIVVLETQLRTHYAALLSNSLSNSSRTPPVMVQIAGPSGIGKSHSLRPNGTLALRFKNMLQLDEALPLHTLEIDNGGFFNNYDGNPISVIEEMFKNGDEDRIIDHAHKMVNTAPYNLVGAFQKENPMAQRLIVCPTNITSMRIRKLDQAAIEPFWNRFMRYRVSSDAIEDAIKKAGTKNVAIDRDPSNWKWERIIRQAPKVPGGEYVDTFEEIDYENAMMDIHRELKRAELMNPTQNFYEQVQALDAGKEIPYACKVKDLPPGFATRKYAQAEADVLPPEEGTPMSSQEHMVIHLTGPPGTGKTTTIDQVVRHWKRMDATAKVTEITDIAQFIRTREYTDANMGDVYILHDKVVTYQQEYHQLYECFSVPVVFMLTSNIQYQVYKDFMAVLKNLPAGKLLYPKTVTSLPEIHQLGLSRRLGFSTVVEIDGNRNSCPNVVSQFHRNLPRMGVYTKTNGSLPRDVGCLPSEIYRAYCVWRTEMVKELVWEEVDQIDSTYHYDIIIKASSLDELRSSLSSDITALRHVGPTPNKMVCIKPSAITKLAESGCTSRTWQPPHIDDLRGYVGRMYALVKRACPTLSLYILVGKDCFASTVPGVILTNTKVASPIISCTANDSFVNLKMHSHGAIAELSIPLDQAAKGCYLGWARADLSPANLVHISTLAANTAVIEQLPEVNHTLRTLRQNVERSHQMQDMLSIKERAKKAINDHPFVAGLCGVLLVYFLARAAITGILAVKDMIDYFRPLYCPTCAGRLTRRNAKIYSCDKCLLAFPKGYYARLDKEVPFGYYVSYQSPLSSEAIKHVQTPMAYNDDAVKAQKSTWQIDNSGRLKSGLFAKYKQERQTGPDTRPLGLGDWNDVGENAWAFADTPPSQLESLAKKCQHNKCTVTVAGERCFGLGVKGRFLYTVAHLWFKSSNIANEHIIVDLNVNGKIVSEVGRLYFLDFSRDIACVRFDGTVDKSYQFKDISKHIISMNELLDSRTGALLKYNQDTNLLLTGELKPSQAFGLSNIIYDTQQRVMTYVHLEKMELATHGVSMKGQCGSPTFAYCNGKWKLLGLFCMAKKDKQNGGAAIITHENLSLCETKAVPCSNEEIPSFTSLTIDNNSYPILDHTAQFMETVEKDDPNVRLPWCARVLGVKRRIAIRKQQIQPTPLKEIMEKEFGPSPCLPVTMSYEPDAEVIRDYTGRKCPYSTELGKMDPKESYDYELRRKAWIYTRTKLQQAYGSFKKATEMEVLNGDREGLNRLRLGSSSGPVMQTIFPGKNQKKDFFRTNENGDIRFAEPLVHSWYLTACRYIQEGAPLLFVVGADIKEELLPREKVLAGKKRLYWVSDLIGILLERTYFGKFLSKIATRPGPITTGFDTRYGWGDYKSLFQKYPYHVDADRSKFDKNIIGGDVQEGIQIILSLSETTARERKALSITYSHYLANVGDALAYFEDGVPSGLFITNMIDSVCSLMHAYYGVLYAIQKVNPNGIRTDVENFYVIANGDDISILSTNMVKVETETIIEGMNDSGIETTPPTKDGTPIKTWQKFPEEPIEFVSRKITLVKGKIMAPLKMGSIMKSLYYARTDTLDQFASLLQATFEELYLHQDQVLYDRVYNLVVNALKIPGHIQPFRTWNDSATYYLQAVGDLVPQDGEGYKKTKALQEYLNYIVEVSTPDFIKPSVSCEQATAMSGVKQAYTHLALDKKQKQYIAGALERLKTLEAFKDIKWISYLHVTGSTLEDLPEDFELTKISVLQHQLLQLNGEVEWFGTSLVLLVDPDPAYYDISTIAMKQLCDDYFRRTGKCLSVTETRGSRPHLSIGYTQAALTECEKQAIVNKVVKLRIKFKLSGMIQTSFTQHEFRRRKELKFPQVPPVTKEELLECIRHETTLPCCQTCYHFHKADDECMYEEKTNCKYCGDYHIDLPSECSIRPFTYGVDWARRAVTYTLKGVERTYSFESVCTVKLEDGRTYEVNHMDCLRFAFFSHGTPDIEHIARVNNAYYAKIAGKTFHLTPKYTMPDSDEFDHLAMGFLACNVSALSFLSDGVEEVSTDWVLGVCVDECCGSGSYHYRYKNAEGVLHRVDIYEKMIHSEREASFFINAGEDEWHLEKGQDIEHFTVSRSTLKRHTREETATPCADAAPTTNVFQEGATRRTPFAFDGAMSPMDLLRGGVAVNILDTAQKFFTLQPIQIKQAASAGDNLVNLTITDLLDSHPYARMMKSYSGRISGGVDILIESVSSANLMNFCIAYLYYPVAGVIPASLTLEQKQYYSHQIEPLSDTSAIVRLDFTTKQNNYFDISELDSIEAQPIFRIDTITSLANVFGQPGDIGGFIKVSVNASRWNFAQIVMPTTSPSPAPRTLENIVDNTYFTETSAIMADGTTEAWLIDTSLPSWYQIGADPMAWGVETDDGFLPSWLTGYVPSKNVFPGCNTTHFYTGLCKVTQGSWGAGQELYGRFCDRDYYVKTGVNHFTRIVSCGTDEQPTGTVIADGQKVTFDTPIDGKIFGPGFEVVTPLPIVTSVKTTTPLSPGLKNITFSDERPHATPITANSAVQVYSTPLTKRISMDLQNRYSLRPGGTYAWDLLGGQNGQVALALIIKVEQDINNWRYYCNESSIPFMHAVMYGGYSRMKVPYEVRNDYVPPLTPNSHFKDLYVNVGAPKSRQARSMPVPRNFYMRRQLEERATPMSFLGGIGQDINRLIDFKRQKQLMDKQQGFNIENMMLSNQLGMQRDKANFGFNSDLSKQNFQQNSSLSGQAYMQERGLIGDRGSWNLANTNQQGAWNAFTTNLNNENRLQMQQNSQNFELRMLGAHQDLSGAAATMPTTGARPKTSGSSSSNSSNKSSGVGPFGGNTVNYASVPAYWGNEYQVPIEKAPELAHTSAHDEQNNNNSNAGDGGNLNAMETFEKALPEAEEAAAAVL